MQIGMALNMNEHLREAGMGFYRLAIGGFIQGRRIKSVAAVALYIACRVQRDSNTYMLIDFADVLEVRLSNPNITMNLPANVTFQIDVFNLGQVYKLLIVHTRVNGPGQVVQPINPEDLILRFCYRLEFGSEIMRVARDAVRIVQRMNRDWMTPGRRPAGICGAALILAARMNNFRRTVREVVYVVKVQEQTIFNRLDEFKATESSGLTVDEFRTIDLERFADPPIFTAHKEGKDGKKKKRRRRMHLEFDDDGDNDQPTVISSRASSVTPSILDGQTQVSPSLRQQAQIDIRNMPPPPLPIDPNLLEDSNQPSTDSGPSSSRATTETATDSQATDNTENTGSMTTGPPSVSTSKETSEPPTKRKRGRKSNVDSKALVTPPATQPTALEADITVAITDPLNIAHANALTSALESNANPLSPQATQQDPQDNPAKKRPPIADTEEIFDSEFADDPEVSNCLLTPSEVTIKTRIWTHENREYLRAQSAKLLKQQLAEENGTARVVVRRKRKRKRMGDMTAYHGEDGEEDGPVAGSPADAVMRMMDRRKYSKKVNYDMLKELYGASSSSTSSRQGSVSLAAQSPGSGSHAPGASSPSAVTKSVENQIEEATEDRREVGGQDNNQQQKTLDNIAGELEEEGINDEEVEEEEDEDEDEDIDEDQYDDDPYEGGGLSD